MLEFLWLTLYIEPCQLTYFTYEGLNTSNEAMISHEEEEVELETKKQKHSSHKHHHRHKKHKVCVK